MKEQLFLYQKPFVVDDTPQNRMTYLLDADRFDEFCRTDDEEIRKLVMKFILSNNVGRILDGVTLANSLETNTGSWIFMLNWMNMRSLVDHQQLSALVAALEAENMVPINSVLDLLSRLGSMFDTRLLNTIANRTIHAISLIPYGVAENRAEITWEKIHRETPFVWLIIFIQTVFKNESVVKL